MISPSQLSRLQKLQNKCVMLINNKKHDQIDDKLFQMLRIPKIKDLLHLENCKFAFKFINGLLPSPIESTLKNDQSGNNLTKKHCYNTRSKNIPNMPSARNKHYKNSVLCKALPSYQTLKVTTKQSQTLLCFVKNLKTDIFKGYS